jgi:ribonuclease-3
VVNTKALATAARRVDLGECVRLGRGEAATGGADKDSILADCTEAVIGAVYLSAGLEPAAATIYRLLGVELAWVETGEDPGDPKSRLQELAAQQFEGGPRYEIGDTGPDHAKEFTAVVMLDGVAYGRGIGRTKKEAEQAAASQALAGIPANESRNT